MDIGAGITFGNGVGISKEPPPPSFVGLIGTTDAGKLNGGAYVAKDSLGNTYTYGYQWIPNTYYTTVIKFNIQGVVEWKKTYPYLLYPVAAGCDSSNNLYIYGQLNSGGIYGSIVKFNSSGVVQWQRQLGASWNGKGSFTVDSAGNSYFMPYLFGDSAIRIAKVDTSGNLSWQKELVGTTGSNWNSGAANPVVDSSGNVYVAGYGTVGSNSVMALVKLTSAGATVWAKSLGKTGTSYDYQPYSMAIDSSDNIYLTHDEGMAKFNSSGTLLSQKGGTTKGSLTIDPSNNLYSLWIASIGGLNKFVITQHNSSGVLQWSNYVGCNVAVGAGGDSGLKIVADSTSVYFGGGVGSSMFFAKLWNDGTNSGIYTLGGSPFSTYTTTIASTTLTPTTPVLTSGSLSMTNTASGYGFGSLGWVWTDSSVSTTTTRVYTATTPSAPTVGTATATSDTTATVTFTAPASDGYSTITTYTATSSPGGITGTLSQAGSGTITVSGLTQLTSYTFTVTATNTLGTSSPSASSNSITTSAPPLSYKALFGFGTTGTNTAITNLVSNTGVVASNTTGVGTARQYLSAAGYGTDKAIFGYGITVLYTTNVSMTNLVSNTGVVANDTAGVGTVRRALAAAGYGTDKALFGYGYNGSDQSVTNKVSNTGVVASDTTGVGTARSSLAAAGYGTDKAIFGYGQTSDGTSRSMTNLVSNTGIVATDTTGVGQARNELAAAKYGTDKAIFGYGSVFGGVQSITNLVSNTGVVASDTTGVGTARYALAAAGYGTDKAIFGYGRDGSPTNVSMTNLVSNTGVVATDTTGVGTARNALAAASYGGT